MRKLTFSTNDLPQSMPREHMARLWSEGLTNGAVRYEAHCPKADEFFGHCEMKPLRDRMLVRASANSISMVRRRSHIAQDAANSLMLLVNDGQVGTVGGSQRGEDIDLALGEAAIFDIAEEYTTHSRDGGAALAYYFDRDLLRLAGPSAPQATTRRLDPTSDVCRLLLPYLRLHLALDGPLEDRAASAAIAHIDDLLTLALGAGGDAAAEARERGVEATRYAAMRRVLMKHGFEPETTADSIGARLGVSGRTLQHLLQRRGTTFSDELASVRLDRAHAILRATASQRMPIAEIAYASGFRELSTFYRAFKRRFGVSPGEIRTQARHSN